MPEVKLYRPPLDIGTPTRWGPIAAVGTLQGERYYWMIDGQGDVAMMPADVVEVATCRKK